MDICQITDFEKELNKEQWRAVQIIDGPILVLAGAGSGKTRVITYRIAYLTSKGINPQNILAVTFTNKAADEMKSRVQYLLGNDAIDIWIKTYHSTCARILRNESEKIGIPGNFVIYDETDQLSLIKECLNELNLDTQDLKPEFVLQCINRAKENLITPDEYTNSGYNMFSNTIRTIYKIYNQRLRECNALDFDDLILKTVELFRTHPEVLEKYQERFKYIMVDEYQDTNHAQYVFTKLLAAKYRNLCVVGDDDQSIYSWRGAEIRNILDFEKDYPETRIIKLEQNYRSTKTILKAASEIVKNNTQRKKKVLWCENEIGEPIEYFDAEDDRQEAEFVARKILEEHYRGRDYNEIAVFYRLNYQSRIFEECFAEYKIPYEVIGALKFYERAEIKNMLAYLRVINNPSDSVSLKRIINLPSRNIGKETVDKIIKFQKENNLTLFEALKHVSEIKGLTKRNIESVQSFVMMIEKFTEMNKNLNLYDLSLRIAHETGYLEHLRSRETEEEINRRKNVEELLISINEYVKNNPSATIQDYLEGIALRSDIDDWSNEKVSLMTLHNAKGLEFEVVFITGIEDRILPHHRALEEGRYEEERRLLYVGITRAKKKLYLTTAEKRKNYQGNHFYTRASPFLKEIPDELFATIYR
ncbi:MAG: UvrD-helicase domain-containing protein [candidate division WOR-3 bacterium]|nr:UvrD-helicase domain-containing protein [candidate division WOR-3 bacterium]